MGSPLNQQPFFYPVSGRRINPDGTVDIKCRICAKTICREPYRRFSTAICAVCNGELEKGKAPEDIMLTLEQQNRLIGQEVKEEIGMGGFKVFGLVKRTREIVKEVQRRAMGRKPKPIFEDKD